MYINLNKHESTHGLSQALLFEQNSEPAKVTEHPEQRGIDNKITLENCFRHAHKTIPCMQT